jgi:hypothetical protein
MTNQDTLPKSGADGCNIVGTLVSLLIEHALPLWSGKGWDHRTGSFIERFDREGRADVAAPRRIRVQARRSIALPRPLQTAGSLKAVPSR